jgi:hypothetical protein
MSLPEPFNTVEELVLWSGFEQGPAQGRQSVLDGTFALSQFESALRESRREIYRRAGRRQNDEYDEARADELKEAERYLATARLYPNFGARMQLEFPESNLASVGDVMTGADTPDPYAKGRQLVEFMYNALRRIGLACLRGDRWSVRPFAVGSDSPPFPFESEYAGIEGSAHDR